MRSRCYIMRRTCSNRGNGRHLDIGPRVQNYLPKLGEFGSPYVGQWVVAVATRGIHPPRNDFLSPLLAPLRRRLLPLSSVYISLFLFKTLVYYTAPSL